MAKKDIYDRLGNLAIIFQNHWLIHEWDVFYCGANIAIIRHAPPQIVLFESQVGESFSSTHRISIFKNYPGV